MRRLLAGAAVGALALLGVAAPAGAAGNDVAIRSVDTTAFPTVKVTAQVPATESVTGSNLTVTENGRAVKGATVTPIGTSGARVGVALVLDTSAAVASGDGLRSVKEAALRYIAGRQAGEQVAIVSVGAPARVLTNFTADPAPLVAAINALGAGGSEARWDAVSLATGLFTEHPELQANVIVVAAAPDAVSKASFDQVVGAAVAARETIHTLALGPASAVGGNALQAMATRTGGQYLETSGPSGASTLLVKAGHLVANQFVVKYTSTASGELDIAVAAGGAASHASIGPGTVASGAALNPSVVKPGKPLPIIGSPSGKWVVTALVMLAAGLLAMGLLRLCFREKADLHAALKPYTDDEEVDEDDTVAVTLAETGFVRRAVDQTAKLAEERGVLEVIEQRLEQADLPLRAAEALFFWAAAVVITAAIGLFLKGIVAAFAAVMIVGVGPLAVLNMLAAKRKAKFMAQLPDALQLLSGSLRSGYSLLQGVEAVSQEAPEPMSTELRRVLIEARLGRPLEDSLQEAADRMGSADFDWAVMAVRIQREVGGNLAELLDTVGETMVQRERLRRDVKSLTAEGRMSAIVLALLPPGVGFMMWTLNPKYVGSLFHDGFGKAMLVGATGLAVGGFIWMKKMIEIEA